MSKKINLGFDAKRLFTNRSGLGNYSRSLVKALSDQFPHVNLHLYTPKVESSELTSWLGTKENIYIHTGRSPAMLWRTIGILSDLVRDNIDIYHGLSAELPVGLGASKIKSVVTIHDCIFKVYPSYYSVIDRHIYNQKSKHAITTADHIVSISDHTRRDICKYFVPGKELSRFSVVPPIVTIKQVGRVDKQEFFIFIGTGNQRKNLITVLKALSSKRKDGSLMHLVVVGSVGLLERNYIHKENLTSQIEVLTDVPTDKLHSLLANARALIFPSLYEGFGMPIVEALHLGTAVVTSSNSAIVEAGSSYVHYLHDPVDHNELADLMGRLGDTIEDPLDYNGLEDHLDQFSSRIVANRLMEIYKSLL